MEGETDSDIEVRALREKVALLEEELEHARALHKQSGCKRKKTEGEVRGEKVEVGLPTGVLERIAKMIDQNDVFAFAMTCKEFREAHGGDPGDGEDPSNFEI